METYGMKANEATITGKLKSKYGLILLGSYYNSSQETHDSFIKKLKTKMSIDGNDDHKRLVWGRIHAMFLEGDGTDKKNTTIQVTAISKSSVNNAFWHFYGLENNGNFFDGYIVETSSKIVYSSNISF